MKNDNKPVCSRCKKPGSPLTCCMGTEGRRTDWTCKKCYTTQDQKDWRGK